MLNDLHRYHTLKFKTIIYIFFIKLFGNTFINSFINICTPIVLSMLFEIPIEERNHNFYKYVFAIIIFIIICNILYYVASYIRSNNDKWKDLLGEVTKQISAINTETGTNIYRMHKHTKSTMDRNEIVDESHFNQIADFQELSFLVCQSIYDIISNELECEECEVTVYQKFPKCANKKYNTIKMIAYATKDSIIPSSYDNIYNISKKAPKTIFMNLFKQNQTESVICHNQKTVEQKFVWLKGSQDREEKIHQYIGIPIKTNSNNVVCVLQVDVSQKKILGKNYKEVKFFADNILKPFSSILYNAYERDSVFNTFYKVWSRCYIHRD